MRLFAAACLLTLTGCAGTDAALEGQDAKNALAAKDSVMARAARAQLLTITSAAQAWVASNGSMAGFAADLRTNNPGVAAAATVLGDAHVAVTVSPGQCLGADLPNGAPTNEAC